MQKKIISTYEYLEKIIARVSNEIPFAAAFRTDKIERALLRELSNNPAPRDFSLHSDNAWRDHFARVRENERFFTRFFSDETSITLDASFAVSAFSAATDFVDAHRILYKYFHISAEENIQDPLTALNTDYEKYNVLPVSARYQLSKKGPLLFDVDTKNFIGLRVTPTLYDLLLDWEDHYKFKLSFSPDPRSVGKYFTNIYGQQGSPSYQQIQASFLTDYPASIFQHLDQNKNTYSVFFKNNEITFEEILAETPVYKNTFVTNLVHLMLGRQQNSGKTIIKHLDHEYLFYTEDEMLARSENPHQKANGLTRLKTFKIDEAELPLDADKILFPVLANVFKNPGAVLEMFRDAVVPKLYYSRNFYGTPLRAK